MESCILNERSWYFPCHLCVGVVPNYRIELVSGERCEMLFVIRYSSKGKQ
jgi:hypothetical protein